MLKFFAKIREYMKRCAEANERKQLEYAAKKAENEAAWRQRHAENDEAWRYDRQEWERIMAQPYDPAAWKERQRLKSERQKKDWEQKAVEHFEKTGKALDPNSSSDINTSHWTNDSSYSGIPGNVFYIGNDE